MDNLINKNCEKQRKEIMIVYPEIMNLGALLINVPIILSYMINVETKII